MILNTMKDSRLGEQLWFEWTGEGFDTEKSVVFCTEAWVDLENGIVRRALASALQRDGIATTLGEGFKLLENAEVTHGHAGYVDDDIDMCQCDIDGETREGDFVAEVLEVTWVGL